MRGIRSISSFFLVLLLTGAVHARKLPDTIVLSPEVMAETKQRINERDPLLMPAYDALIQDAERAVMAPAESVILKPAPPPKGNRHDYWSLAPDWWPDPNRTGGVPYVQHPEERNPEADTEKYDRQRLHRMANDALTLALAWYLTGKEEYAGKGTALVWSWCCDSVTRTEPHMKFAHARPGVSIGQHSGIIETRDMIKVAEAARILEPSHAWSKVVTRKLTTWFKDYVKWLLTSKFGQLESEENTSHGTWYDAQVAVFALYAGDTSLARSIIGTAERRRIGVQIERNGAMPDALERADSRRATFSNLEAFFVLAAVGERLDLDLWHWEDPYSGSIKKALDYAAPYISPKEPWPFGHTGKFDPFDFTPLFHRAALVYKDKRYLKFLTALPGESLLQDRAQLFY